MHKVFPRLFVILTICLCFAMAPAAKASHLYGADFNYTWVSGNTYRISLTVYGDCAGGAFPSLNGSTPFIYIFDGPTQIATLSLNQQGIGVEVTPVCAAQQNQTKCTNPGFATPGIKRYIYSNTYTLSGVSANWRFVFNGDLGASTAGRTAAITNIVTSGATVTALEATLNNTVGANSNPVYSTIPTPFFCVNKPANYNPGTVDVNGDALSFALVTGLNAGTTPAAMGFVTYVPPFTATAPLDVVPASLVFNTTNGQLDFTPRSIQQSLIVSRVSEYRGGVLVGTSMREMTFVVQTCNNNPPTGVVSGPSTGVKIINGTSLTVCKEQGLFTFSINPTDADLDAINVVAAGLPAGATFTVTGNNTAAPTGLFSWDVSGVTPGTYTFFVTYTDNGCPLSSKQTLAYTITVLPNPALTYTLIRPATCKSKAVFTVTPANAGGPYIINLGTITRSAVTGTITDSLDPGTYTFTVTATNGCSHDTSITIASPATIIPGAAVAKSTCNTLANGSVILSATGGTAPFTYALGTGAYTTATTFSPLAAGNYTFHIKDAQGCIRDTIVAIRDSLEIHSTVTVTDVLCNGGVTGAIQVVANGGASPYVYALNSGVFGTATTFSTLGAGAYIVRIKDNLGCLKDTTAVIAQPALLVPNASVVNLTCNGLPDGIITVNATGGTPGYTYAIGTGPYNTSRFFSGLAAGVYTIHVRDLNNCQADALVTVTEPAPVAFSFVVSNVLCNGGSTGTVTINATGGTPGYTYAADAGTFGASNVVTGLNAGTHTIHLRDARSCFKDSSVVLTEPAVLGISFTATNPNCFAGKDGTITVKGTGGTTAYSYALDAGAFVPAANFTGVGAGTYAVHIKDANGCTKDTSATLTEPSAILVSASVMRPRCTPLVNGAVTLAATGGTPGYTYARGAGAYAASPVFTGLGSGTYIFHVKDSKNCIKDTSVTVADSVFVHAPSVVSDAKCFNQASGAITIAPAGGDLPYQFALGTAPYTTTNPIINLLAATYVLHVKDANGCILDTNITVGQPTIIVPAVTVTQPLCYAGSDGVLAVSSTGGTPTYTYALGTGAYAAATSFPGLTAGTYVIHTKDQNGCIRDTAVLMGQPTKLVFGFITMTQLICNGDNSGTITMRASGGTPSYTFAADNRAYQAANVLTGLAAGIRVAHVKDANGCVIDTSLRLFEPDKVHVLIPEVITPTCEGFKDGMIRIDATGGTPGYTYSATNTSFDTQRVYPKLPEGTYTFFAKDSRGCPGDTTFKLIGYPHIDINTTAVTSPSCNGMINGSFAMNVTGGNQPLVYIMKNPADTNTTGFFDSLKAAAYVVRVVDAKGCFKDANIQVTQPDTLLGKTIITPNDCVGYDDGGGVEVAVTGGTAPYRYLWSTNPPRTADRISGMANGRYGVIVTDAHNCTDTVVAIVPYDNCCKPFVPDAFTPNGDGKNDIFHILYKGDIKLESFSIFNRYGQRVFYTTVPETGWDGVWNDRMQDVGTYFYYIKLICGNKGDNVQEYKGDLTLIR